MTITMEKRNKLTLISVHKVENNFLFLFKRLSGYS